MSTFEITDEMVEAGARQLAALKMGLVNDPNGLRLPDDLWTQVVPQARAVLTAVAPAIRAAALEERGDE